MAEMPITAIISVFQNFTCPPANLFPFCIESPLLCLNRLPEPGHCIYSRPALRFEYIFSLPLGAGPQVEVPRW